MQTIVCLLCGRASASHRQTCLYCGEALPGAAGSAGGSGALADPGGELAPELDRLVRQALTGGDTAGLHEVLTEVQARRSPAATLGSELPEPVASPAPPSIQDVLSRLSDAAQRAIACQSDGDLSGLHEALRQASAAATLATSLAPHEAPARETAAAGPTRPVPSFHALGRHPFALVVEGRGMGELAGDLAAAMGTDLATARQIALSRHARLVSRGEDPVRLAQMADEIERRAGLRAVVVHRDELRTAPDPVLVLGLERDRLRITNIAVWLAPETTVVEGRMDMPEIRLGVPGEVAVRRFRRGRDLGAFARRTTSSGVRDLGEQRSHVLDLHGPGVALRLIEGITDLRGLPGVEGQASLRSWSAMLERAHERWHGLVLEGPRICAAETAPPGAHEPEQDGPLQSSGWPAWEEHTRICRLLAEPGWR